MRAGVQACERRLSSLQSKARQTLKSEMSLSKRMLGLAPPPTNTKPVKLPAPRPTKASSTTTHAHASASVPAPCSDRDRDRDLDCDVAGNSREGVAVAVAAEPIRGEGRGHGACEHVPLPYAEEHDGRGDGVPMAPGASLQAALSSLSLGEDAARARDDMDAAQRAKLDQEALISGGWVYERE
jgi:hypothetical protein